MKKLKFSIISLSVLLSFGLTANEQDVSLYESAKQDEQKNIVKDSSKKRSNLRNKASITELENEVLDEEITRLQKELAIKKLKFTLSNIPPQYLDRVEEYLQKEYFEEKVDPMSLYPSLREKVESFNTFPQETYEIDQALAIPKASQRFSNYDNEVKKSSQKKEVINDKEDVFYVEESNSLDVEIIEPEKETLEVPVSNKVNETKNEIKSETEIDSKLAEDFKEVEVLLTEEEKAMIELLKNGENTIKIETGLDEEDIAAKEALEIQKVFSRIENAIIDSVFIFGEDKSVDLKMTFYVGDGGEGETLNNTIREVKEDQIISVRGFKYKIKNISFKEVEIENLEDNTIYVASKSVRNAR